MRRIVATRHGEFVHVDIKQLGRTPTGGEAARFPTSIIRCGVPRAQGPPVLRALGSTPAPRDAEFCRSGNPGCCPLVASAERQPVRKYHSVMADGNEEELRLELDSEGRDAGVEYEAVEDEEVIREPFDPRLIDVTTETRSLDTLVRRVAAGQINLDPDFQRSRGIWTDKKKSLLIESLLLRIPLPTFYVAEVDRGSDLGDDCWAVVDGIQRLSTAVQFVQPAALGLPALALKGLEYLKAENGKTFQELSTSLQLRLLESQFTIQVIRKSTPEQVQLNIFARINTGGVPLSAQELRHALIPGTARQTLRDMAKCSEFQEAVAHSVSPSRMVDREMALRYLAFRLSEPELHRETDFDKFLRTTMRQINAWSDEERAQRLREFSAVMLASTAIFGKDAFRKRYQKLDPRRPVSKALFEAVAVGLARTLDKHGPNGIATLVSKADEVTAAFHQLMGDRDFDRSISQGTGDPVRVRLRFERLRQLFWTIVESTP